MKTSKLLASTALVASAAAFAAAPASAAKLKLGGYFEQWVGFASDGVNASATAPHSEFDVQQDAEIYFSFKEKLSNGLTVGGRVEMEAQEGTSGYDENAIYVSGAFGKIQIGSNDVAAAGVGNVDAVGPVGINKSDAKKWLPGLVATINSDNDLGMSDEQNVMYTSPKMNGLQVAVSYTPESSDSGARTTATTSFTDGFSSMVKYSTKMGGASVSVGLGYSSNKSASVSGVSQDGVNGQVKISSGPLTFAAAYMKEDLATVDDTFTGASVVYKLDKVNAISLSYGNYETKTISSGATVDDTVYTLGFSRNLGKGVTFAASIFDGETKDTSDATANADGHGVVGGFKVKF
jgi:hypothetical protein